RRGGAQLFPCSIATGTPQTFSVASVPTLFIDAGVVQPPGTCAAVRPISTRLEPVLALRGFDHWFLLSYTFPSCLPDPSRLTVPPRCVVIRAAPALPCVSRVRLPLASVGRCDGSLEGSFHPLTVKQRLVAHDGSPVHASGLHRDVCDVQPIQPSGHLQ